MMVLQLYLDNELVVGWQTQQTHQKRLETLRSLTHGGITFNKNLTLGMDIRRLNSYPESSCNAFPWTAPHPLGSSDGANFISERVL